MVRMKSIFLIFFISFVWKQSVSSEDTHLLSNLDVVPYTSNDISSSTATEFSSSSSDLTSSSSTGMSSSSSTGVSSSSSIGVSTSSSSDLPSSSSTGVSSSSSSDLPSSSSTGMSSSSSTGVSSSSSTGVSSSSSTGVSSSSSTDLPRSSTTEMPNSSPGATNPSSSLKTTSPTDSTHPPTPPNNDVDELQQQIYILSGVVGGFCFVTLIAVTYLFISFNKFKKAPRTVTKGTKNAENQPPSTKLPVQEPENRINQPVPYVPALSQLPRSDVPSTASNRRPDSNSQPINPPGVGVGRGLPRAGQSRGLRNYDNYGY